MRGKIVQQPKLQRTEFHLLTRDTDRMCGRVNVDVAMEQGVSLRRRVLPPEQSTHAGDKFPHTERLCDVVIGAKFQPDNPVRFFTTGCQHQDWDRCITFIAPKLPADFETVHSRQHEVQHHKVGRFAAHFRKSKTAVGNGTYAKSFFFQIVTKQFYDISFIFDD